MMDHHCIFVLLTIIAGAALSKVYYVVPSLEKQCEDNPCITLTQFATNYNLYFDETDTTLVFEPGKHMLNIDLMIGNISQFTIISRPLSIPTVTFSNSATIGFFNITLVHIRGIQFIGCGKNRFIFVNRFILSNTTFMNHPGHSSGTALQLILTSAAIIQCSFINLVGTFQNISVSGAPVNVSFGGAIMSIQSDLLIIKSTFQGNSATLGGALYARKKSNITILNTTFVDNRAVCHDELCRNQSLLELSQGGALRIQKSNLLVQHTIFDSNYARASGGAIHAIQSNIRTTVTTFINNSASMNETNRNFGGAVSAIQSIINFTECTFNLNMADYGGAMATQGSFITVNNNAYSDNRAKFDGGVLAFDQDVVQIISCQFFNNSANQGGSIVAQFSSITTAFSLFTNCTSKHGGVMFAATCSIELRQNTFQHNYAIFGGVLGVLGSNLTTREDIFIFNTGEVNVVAVYMGTVTIHSTFIDYNRAIDGSVFDMFHAIFISRGIVNIINNTAGRAIMEYDLCQIEFSGRTMFHNNTGSIALVNSNATFNGIAYVYNCSTINTSLPSMLMIHLSRIIFNGISIIVNNQAVRGGAMFLSETQAFLRGENIIGNNVVINEAGGLNLYKSELNCKGNSTLIIYGNKAGTDGGGIFAESSSIFVTDDFVQSFLQNETFVSSINIVKNQAKQGGGVSLYNSNLYILTYGISHYSGKIINFTQNIATQYGGAVYVDDHSNVCYSNKTEYAYSGLCFLQMLLFKNIKVEHSGHTYIHFSKNYAEMAGATIFGGLFDRCVVQNGSHPSDMTGISFLRLISNIDTLDSISSDAVRVCFCRGHKPDCSYEHPPIHVMKGYPFTVSLVAVDQVNNTVNFSSISSYLKSNKGALGVDQRAQNTKEACTDLTYNVFSPNTSTELTLLANGPCGDAAPSVKRIKISFIPCSCPIGFQPTHADETKCECGCDPNLPYNIKQCDPHTESLLREGSFWIAYINGTDNSSSGYIGYRHCPLDYCLPASSKVNITLSIPNGSDVQCAFNRSGLLCGGCKPHYSISLGSSHCIQCSSHQVQWIVPVIILAALIGGIVLVAMLLFLNLTVARGTVNGIIFYANIAFANQSSFFPFSKPNIISVINAWLNLEIGLDTCFYSGMDMYWKIWIQLAFSAYVFFLIAMIIIISERSTILSSIIRRKNPVATLATLVLLSYTKLLHITISALSYAVIKYPNSSIKIVWLSDATHEYWSGKHIALFLIAIAILFVGIFYTAVLFFWQWLLPRNNWKILCCIKNQKLCMFIETYHAPYNFKHRYWTGLLLLVRIILSIVSAVNVSGDPAINLVANCVLIITLLVLKLYLQGAQPIYKTWLIDILESACLLNILTFSLFKLYYLAENTSQVFIAYLSGTIMIIKFASVLVYHVCTEILIKTKVWTVIRDWIKKRRRENDVEEEFINILASTSDDETEATEPTFSIIERPTPQKPLSEMVEASGKNEENI